MTKEKKEIRYCVLRLTPEYFKKLKIACAETEMPMQKFVLEAIEEKIKKAEK